MHAIFASRAVKWVGYCLFAVVAFVISIYLTFPFDRLKSRVEQFLSASGEMSVRIDSLGPSPLLGATAEGVLVVLKPKPKPPAPMARYGAQVPGAATAAAAGLAQPADKPKPIRMLLDEVTVGVGLFALLGGGLDLDVDVNAFGGTISGSYETDKVEGWKARLKLDRVRLGRIGLVRHVVGLPVAGALSADVELSVPKHRITDASGRVSVECDDCSVGDGKALLKVPGNPLLAMGITLPKVRLGQLGGDVAIEKGVATFENVSAKSPDVELALEGTLALRKPLGYSNSQAYLKFKISDGLKKRDAKFELVENAFGKAKRPDGFFGVRLAGPLQSLKPIPSRVGPRQGGVGAGGRRSGRFGRRGR